MGGGTHQHDQHSKRHHDRSAQRRATDRRAVGRIPAWWLDHPELDADGLAVLAALSTYADEAGVCWPSQTTLASKLKRSRPTVNRILGRLEALGLVAIEHRSAANGGRLSCRYRLCLTPIATPDSKADSPCPPPSHKQHQSKQILDSLPERQRMEPVASSEVPADWAPSADDRDWAATRFPDADLDRHAELFVRRCQAHGYRYRDIGAAWRSWLLQDIPATATRPLRKTTPPQRAAEAEQRVSAWASVAAHLNAGSTASPWM